MRTRADFSARTFLAADATSIFTGTAARGVRSRRRIGADGIARGQARHPAHPPSIPCGGRTMGRADGDQQCRNAGQRAAHYSGRRGVVRKPWHAQKWRHALVLPERAHLERPGVYELPMGYNLKKMIYDVGGGIPNGRKLKAVVPGGSSCSGV